MPVLKRDDHEIYYEVHGQGPPALVMGGWGTFCHGGELGIPWAVLRHRTVVIFDYPGVGLSAESPNRPATTQVYAADAAAVLSALGLDQVDVVGLVGLGACVAQYLALCNPPLVRSLVMTGTWARPDPQFTDQLEGFRCAHLKAGFETFQLLVASFSFTPEYYNTNRDRLIGPQGAWSALQGRANAHSRLVDACLSHDALEELPNIICPAFVVHAGQDVITRPDMTREIEKALPNAQGFHWPEIAHVIAGKDQRTRFDEILTGFYSSISET